VLGRRPGRLYRLNEHQSFPTRGTKTIQTLKKKKRGQKPQRLVIIKVVSHHRAPSWNMAADWGIRAWRDERAGSVFAGPRSFASACRNRSRRVRKSRRPGGLALPPTSTCAGLGKVGALAVRAKKLRRPVWTNRLLVANAGTSEINNLVAISRKTESPNSLKKVKVKGNRRVVNSCLRGSPGRKNGGAKAGRIGFLRAFFFVPSLAAIAVYQSRGYCASKGPLILEVFCRPLRIDFDRDKLVVVIVTIIRLYSPGVLWRTQIDQKHRAHRSYVMGNRGSGVWGADCSAH